VALGGGTVVSGGNVGRAIVGVGATAARDGLGLGSGPSPASPVYVRSPAAIRETPVAVKSAGTSRLRSIRVSLPTGSTA
jgi:hypothetical protein